MDQSEGILHRLLGERSRLFELLVSAVVLAFGVNLLSAQLEDSAGLVVGVIALGGALTYLAVRVLLGRKRSAQFAAFLVARRGGGLVPVPAYALSENVSKVISRAVVERPDQFSLNAADEHPTQLFVDAAEYLLLDDISRKLDAHFGSGLSPERVVVLDRDELSDLVAANQFLELFSTPIEQRPAFRGVEMTWYQTPDGRSSRQRATRASPSCSSNSGFLAGAVSPVRSRMRFASIHPGPRSR